MVVGKVPVSRDRGAQCPDVHGVLAIISPAWRHSGSYRSANKGKPLATSTSEILMQKVIKQFSIRRLLRLDLTNDNALRYQGTSV